MGDTDDKDEGEDRERDKPRHDDLRADRESEYSQGSWVGGGRVQAILSAERLSDAFKSDPAHDHKHDSSWRTHKVEEDQDPDKPNE